MSAPAEPTRLRRPADESLRRGVGGIGHAGEFAQVKEEPTGPLPEDGPALAGQDVLCDLPAGALAPEESAGGYPHVVEEGLTKLVDAGHGFEWADSDAWAVHVDEECADAFRATPGPFRAGQHDAACGVVGPTGPELLASDDPLVAVSLCGGAQ